MNKPKSKPQPDARGRFLDHAYQLIARRVEAGEVSIAELSLRKLAGAAVSPTSATKYFQDQYDVCAALLSQKKLAKVAVPEHIRDVLEAGAQVHYRRLSASAESVLIAKLKIESLTVEQALANYAQARQLKKPVLIIGASAGLARAYLANNDFESAREAADRGLSGVTEYERDEVEAGIECAALGAHAARILSRTPEKTARNLSFVEEYKSKEADWALRLHLKSRAATARFHALRADSLLKDDPDRSLKSFLVVADNLEKAADEGDLVEHDELALILSRLCSDQLAYASRFTDEHKDARRRLTNLYGLTRGTRRGELVETIRGEARKSALALQKVIDSAPDFKIAMRAVDMVRIESFGAVGQLCLARVLRSQYFLAKDESVKAPAVSNALVAGVEIGAEDYLFASLDYYRRASETLRLSGSSGVLRTAAVREASELTALTGKGLPTGTESWLPPLKSETVDAITDAIDRLVLAGLLAQRAQFTQLGRLREQLAPVYNFIYDRAGLDPVLYERPAD